MAALSITALLLLALSSHFIIPSSSSSPPAPFKKIYAFGDSFTDTGNTGNANGPSGFGHVSNLPYGMTYFHRPTNRYSDGRLVIDFVAESLSLPFVPPYRNVSGDSQGKLVQGKLTSVNFAVAGSTAINYDFFVKNNLSLDITPQSIMNQLIWFNKLVEKGRVSSKEFEDALFWIGEIGINDYAYTIGSEIRHETIRKLAISNINAFLESLLKRGAKYMVVQGLLPSGCLPLTMFLSSDTEKDNLGCVKSVNNITDTHNAVLLSKLTALRKTYPAATIIYADYAAAYRTVMSNPSRFGFTQRFNACCGAADQPYRFAPFETCGSPAASACKKPSEYINWDGVHLTEAMYKVLADMFVKGGFSHPTFKALVGKKGGH